MRVLLEKLNKGFKQHDLVKRSIAGAFVSFHQFGIEKHLHRFACRIIRPTAQKFFDRAICNIGSKAFDEVVVPYPNGFLPVKQSKQSNIEQMCVDIIYVSVIEGLIYQFIRGSSEGVAPLSLSSIPKFCL